MFLKKNGVRIYGRRSVFIAKTVKIGKNVTVYENNRIEGDTVIEDGVTVMPGCYIKDCVIGSGSVIISTHAEKAKIGKGCSVGPFARLRPSAEVGDGAKIGNFVEIKNSRIGSGCKVSHLAYVGDADLGENCNIGCGVIFANYNGKEKHRTVVGSNCFIGSNSNLVAPLKIEDNAYICAGTTVTEDLAEGDFAIGRVRQEVKSGRAYKYLKKKEENR